MKPRHVIFVKKVHSSAAGAAELWTNGIKLRWNGQLPEADLRERREQAGLAGLSRLVAAAGALGLAGVAAPGPLPHEAARQSDLEGQVGERLVKLRRGKMSRSR